VSIAVSCSFAACAWCGLLSEAGPVCSICGSPALDIAGWTTVLDVTWPVELPPPARSHEADHHWVSLDRVADLFRIPELTLRSWLEDSPEREEPRLLLIEPGIQTPPPPTPDPPAILDPIRVAEAEPSGPSLWVAPMPAPQPFRLEAAWAFQPTETERRLIRLEMLRTRGATMLAIGIGATGVIYLIDHALQ
jgi:hypothetical protein